MACLSCSSAGKTLRPMEEEVAGLGEGEEIDEDIENGIRFAKKMKDPLMPDKHEIAEPQITHLPYRDWYRHCVRGRGRQLPHQASKGVAGLPEIHFDFCFVGE